jgi:hypothetical protein
MDSSWTRESGLMLAAIFGVAGLFLRWLGRFTAGKKVDGRRPIPKRGTPNHNLVEGGLAAITIGFLIGIASLLPYANDAGYFPHSMTASVFYPEHGWEVGEYQYCEGFLNNDKSAVLNCNESIEKLTPTREMDVRVWGVLGTGKTSLALKCQRETDNIVCHLLSHEDKR